jgi:IS30 family transposase
MAKKTKKKKTKRTHLSEKEKSTVKRMTKAGATMREIAKKIRRAPSTIWRWQQR